MHPAPATRLPLTPLALLALLFTGGLLHAGEELARADLVRGWTRDFRSQIDTTTMTSSSSTRCCTGIPSSPRRRSGPRRTSPGSSAAPASRSPATSAASASSRSSRTATARPSSSAPRWTPCRSRRRPACPTPARCKARDGYGNMVGVMHACGHDVHMTCWIGAARSLAALKDRWSGTLVFIAQPAEEIGHGRLPDARRRACSRSSRGPTTASPSTATPSSRAATSPSRRAWRWRTSTWSTSPFAARGATAPGRTLTIDPVVLVGPPHPRSADAGQPGEQPDRSAGR